MEGTRTPTFIYGLYTGIVIGVIICSTPSIFPDKPEQPEIKPCKHLTLRETLNTIAKYEKFVDSEYTAKNKETKARLQDSVEYYKNILIESDNLIEK